MQYYVPLVEQRKMPPPPKGRNMMVLPLSLANLETFDKDYKAMK
jgi:hypothetical protein